MTAGWVSTGLHVPLPASAVNGCTAAISFGGDIFLVTNSNGTIGPGAPNLYRSVGGVGAFSSVANFGQNSGGNYGYEFSDLFVFGGELYGWSTHHGILFKWNGSNAWIFIGQGDLVGAGSVGGAMVQSGIAYLSVHGRVNQYNGSAVSLASDLGGDFVQGFQMFLHPGTNDLYIGSTSGRLFRRTNGGVFSELVASQLNAMGYAAPFVLGGNVYGLMQNCRLYQYNGSGAWTQLIGETVAGSVGAAHLLVNGGVLYFGVRADANDVGGQLYSWDGAAGSLSLLASRYSNYDNIGQVFLHGSRLMAVAYRYNSANDLVLLEYRDEPRSGIMPAFIPGL